MCKSNKKMKIRNNKKKYKKINKIHFRLIIYLEKNFRFKNRINSLGSNFSAAVKKHRKALAQNNKPKSSNSAKFYTCLKEKKSQLTIISLSSICHYQITAHILVLAIESIINPYLHLIQILVKILV